MNSASAGGVNFSMSGFAPATVMPGISQVRVYDMTRENRNRFPLQAFGKLFCAVGPDSLQGYCPIMDTNSCSGMRRITGFILFSRPSVEVSTEP